MEDSLVTCRIFISRSQVMATTKQLKKGEMHSGVTLKISTNLLQGETEGQQPWPAQRGAAHQEGGTAHQDIGTACGALQQKIWELTLSRGGVNCRATSGGVNISSLQHLLQKALFTKIHIFFNFLVWCYFVQTPQSHWKLLLEKSPLATLRIGICETGMTKKITIIWEQFISCCYRLANTHFHTTYRYVCISLFWYWEKTHLYSFNTRNPWLEFLVGQIMLKKEILEFLPVPWDYSGRQTLLQPQSYQRKAKSPH